jgi:molybdate transport system ATP-binding protein
VRTELDVALADFAGCTVLVTHDPLDALLLADRVIVLEEGRIVQDAPPEELARRPLTPYVAALMGVTLLRGTAADGLLSVDGGGVLHLADHHVHGRALAVVRPEAVTLHLHEPEGSARNAWRGRVASLQPAQDRVRVLVDGEPSVIAVVTPAAIAELGIMRGTPVWLSLKAVDVDVYSTPAH